MMRYTGYDMDYTGPATEPSEGERLVKLIGDKKVLFMGNHGIATVAESVAEAFDLLYYTERAAQVQIYAMWTGQKLLQMPRDVVETTRKRGRPAVPPRQALRLSFQGAGACSTKGRTTRTRQISGQASVEQLQPAAIPPQPSVSAPERASCCRASSARKGVPLPATSPWKSAQDVSNQIIAVPSWRGLRRSHGKEQVRWRWAAARRGVGLHRRPQCLCDAGLKPDIMVGTSISAIVGGHYAAGRLQNSRRSSVPSRAGSLAVLI
jgi:hypothetical protein